jgi:hypothetical protein
MTIKSFGWGALALAVVFFAGWILGASGRSTIEQNRRVAEDRAAFAEIRAHALDGRVSLYLANFGDASRHFEEATAAVLPLQARLRQAGDAERAGRLEIVLGQLREAQRLSARFDASAQSAAAEALRALDAVAGKNPI